MNDIDNYWIGYTTHAYIGLDEDLEPKYAQRKFYRCANCRSGTAVKTPYCAYCGTKMEESE